MDPTARMQGVLVLGESVYIAPFSQISLGGSRLVVGNKSDVQDNVSIQADLGREVRMGAQTILAHGCSVVGPVTFGTSDGAPTFVGFNARVEGAIMEPRSMVAARARLGPGIVLHSGKKVLPGRNVTSQQEADDNSLGKVADMVPADDTFMQGVLTVNIDLAHGYHEMALVDPSAVSGIGPDPVSNLHPQQMVPTFAGQPVRAPNYTNRIIGDIRFGEAFLSFVNRLGQRNSLRADEGGPFAFGSGLQIADEVTVHALEHSEISVGANCQFGFHSVIHGGEDLNAPSPQVTTLGNNIQVEAGAVVFRSTLGDGCVIGAGALVDSCTLTAGTVVAPKTILIGNVNQGTISW
ncbi:MAG: hypothetical protein J0I12_28720 [Candidatus Eremiobacteraeota bacterium]|nr:hypothetical protein [Candidatus Eremiobacteraeota bacterium]